MAKVMTFDEAFVDLLVRGDEAGIQKLNKLSQGSKAQKCPDCGGTDIMDNGEKQVRYLTFACKDCGQQWDAAREPRR
jgi:predicted RNA-binding Zn-ribbon protein involved in translation (DUF1610 family)